MTPRCPQLLSTPSHRITAPAEQWRKVSPNRDKIGYAGVEAALDGYSACGKTGTAQKIGKDGTYAQDRYVASFAGFTPVEDPRLAILVIIDEPHGEDHYGGTVAAPVFREIAQSALSYLNVRPSERAPKMTVSNTTKGTG